MARRPRVGLTAAGVLPAAAVAIEAIAFDKTPTANRKITWHQDVMFPFARAVGAPGYAPPTKKDGVDDARPPRVVLERLLAVRTHLHDGDETNGRLRVAPGSHAAGSGNLLAETDPLTGPTRSRAPSPGSRGISCRGCDPPVRSSVASNQEEDSGPAPRAFALACQL